MKTTVGVPGWGTSPGMLTCPWGRALIGVALASDSSRDEVSPVLFLVVRPGWVAGTVEWTTGEDVPGGAVVMAVGGMDDDGRTVMPVVTLL
ncbi:hypothetical protein ORV05_10765 [Amycolatopsis cynarae]|uniref:Uncharacterized protein n=1 Tax=Amycolatopsis cynarae TaxID=2995223 RepID=A0ABY7B7B0_9PSEU|nr:hypothetical protein [Amycolatopsis sp. HUAS 11-8]WAL68215.1 hypothetical protein ORV05_10765 [Amycolatopsis sp. HUAS 11-8]